MLSDQTINELRQILKIDNGKDVTIAEASEIAYSLIGYFDLLAIINHRTNHGSSVDKSSTKPL